MAPKKLTLKKSKSKTKSRTNLKKSNSKLSCGGNVKQPPKLERKYDTAIDQDVRDAYNVVTARANKWLNTPGARANTFPVTNHNYNRNRIMKENPYGKAIATLNSYAVSTDMQDESCYPDFDIQQRPYVNLLTLDEYAIKLVQSLKSNRNIGVFAGPMSDVYMYGNDLAIENVKTISRGQKSKCTPTSHPLDHPYINLTREPGRDITNFFLMYFNMENYEYLKAPMYKYKDRVWVVHAYWGGKYCEKGSTKRFLDTLITKFQKIVKK